MSSSLSSKRVFITGGSSGIGRACAAQFADAGAHVFLTARGEERLQRTIADLRKTHPGVEIDGGVLDVRDAAAAETFIHNLPPKWQEVDVLINNAGLSRQLDPVYANTVSDIDDMIDTNVKGLLYVTRAIVPKMIARNAGHIINLGSTAGHDVYPGGTVYCASKFAVGAITQGLKMDLHGTEVRVSTVDPGLVETDFSNVRFHGDTERAATVYADTIPLSADDVAEAVIWCASRPLRVNIHEVIMRPIYQSSSYHLQRGMDRAAWEAAQSS